MREQQEEKLEQTGEKLEGKAGAGANKILANNRIIIPKGFTFGQRGQRGQPVGGQHGSLWGGYRLPGGREVGTW